MSFRVFGKLLRCLGISAFLWFALPSAGWAQTFGAPIAVGGCATCGPTCQTHHCPPAYKHCYEGAPHIHWTRGCPHPICNPCDLPHWGYFDTCWTPWPFPPQWGHCPTVPPAALVQLNPMVHPQMPLQRAPGMLPQPGGVLPTPSLAPMPQGSPEELTPPRQVERQR